MRISILYFIYVYLLSLITDIQFNNRQNQKHETAQPFPRSKPKSLPLAVETEA
jgi:hypothetical protein